jgi:hypothetical protein
VVLLTLSVWAVVIVRRKKTIYARPTRTRPQQSAGLKRPLRFEQLEDRRLLSITVNTLIDENDGINVGGISLRDAIAAAAPNDTINFAPSLTAGGPATILLTHGDLAIAQGLTINGPGSNLLTIDAQQQSRIMHIDNPNTVVDNFTVTLAGLTLTGGYLQNAGDMGGAVLAKHLYLIINDCTIEGNHTSGDTGWGGAIFSEGYVTATNSIFRDNYTTGDDAVGGAIFARGDITLTDSTVTHNHTTGADSLVVTMGGAGGVRSNGKVVLLRSTVSGNWTEGNYTAGGGIQAVGDIILTNSTVSGNYTLGFGSPGGGIFTFFGVDITQSTISGNSTKQSLSPGGGISVRRQVSITQSTITDNSTEQSGYTGGGLYQKNYSNDFPVTITGTIIAGNRAFGGSFDLTTDPQSIKTVNYSLIGNTADSGITETTGIGNLLNVNPALGPLADHGGPTQTHALLPGSPAIDAGDPNFSATTSFDQRGTPFTRVFDGDGTGGARIDMGAFEFITSEGQHTLFGDYNLNGVVDAADYTVWRDALGANVVAYSIADGNGNGIVDQPDYDVWMMHFGQTVAGAGGGAESAEFVAKSLGQGTGSANSVRVAPAEPPASAPSILSPGDAVKNRITATVLTQRPVAASLPDESLVASLTSRAGCHQSHEDSAIDSLVQDQTRAESTVSTFATVDEVFAAMNEFHSGTT